MKKLLFSILILVLIIGCNTKSKSVKNYDNKTEIADPEQHNKQTTEIKSTAQAIADANGIEHWNKVSEIKFTFNVDQDTSHFERSWSWKPKKDSVRLITSTDTVSYSRKNISKEILKSDQGFINDKFWLLAQFNLVWDKEHYTETLSVGQTAPISQKKMQKLTIVYDNEGGYTPGDAYDYYFEGDFVIKEWVFRKQNATTPSLITSWTDYKNYNGIKIAKTHQRKDANWKLHFTNIEVLKE